MLANYCSCVLTSCVDFSHIFKYPKFYARAWRRLRRFAGCLLMSNLSIHASCNKLKQLKSMADQIRPCSQALAHMTCDEAQ